MAFATSSTSTDSFGLWLIPPGERRKTIAEGTFSARIMASWPAPLTMRYGVTPDCEMAVSISRTRKASIGVAV